MPYKDKNDPRLIAYRKAYYERTKEGRYERIKHNVIKWRENHPGLYEQLRKEYYYDNRDAILVRQKEHYKKHKEKRLDSAKKRCAELTDKYMKPYLLKLGYSRQDLRKYPEIIEVHKLLIKTKRLCKTSEI